MDVDCPICKHDCGYTAAVLITHNFFTLDCQNCGQLLYNDDGVLVDFHARIHEGCPAWPADGRGTGYLELQGGGYSLVEQLYLSGDNYRVRYLMDLTVLGDYPDDGVPVVVEIVQEIKEVFNLSLTAAIRLWKDRQIDLGK